MIFAPWLLEFEGSIAGAVSRAWFQFPKRT